MRLFTVRHIRDTYIIYTVGLTLFTVQFALFRVFGKYSPVIKSLIQIFTMFCIPDTYTFFSFT